MPPEQIPDQPGKPGKPLPPDAPGAPSEPHDVPETPPTDPKPVPIRDPKPEGQPSGPYVTADPRLQ